MIFGPSWKKIWAIGRKNSFNFARWRTKQSGKSSNFIAAANCCDPPVRPGQSWWNSKTIHPLMSIHFPDTFLGMMPGHSMVPV